MSTKSPHRPADPTVKWEEIEGGMSILKPRGFSITWGNEAQYWRVPENGPAELLNVCLLELYASKEIDPKKSYEVGFSVSLKSNWIRNCPIFIMVKRGEKGNYIARKVNLEGRELRTKFNVPENFVIKFLPGDSSEPKITIGLLDYWNNNWKRGLLVHHAFVREVN